LLSRNEKPPSAPDTVGTLSPSQGWTGTDQVRFFKLEGDSLTIKTAPQKNAITGIDNVSVFIWERER